MLFSNVVTLFFTMEDRIKLIAELHKPIKKKFLRRRVLCYYIDDLWQSDLTEFIPYSKENNGMKYLLTTIDVFSKYAWAIPLKTKTSLSVANAFKSILDSSKRCPTNLQTDNGKQILNNVLKYLTFISYRNRVLWKRVPIFNKN